MVELVRKVLSEQNKALGLILSIAKPGVVKSQHLRDRDEMLRSSTSSSAV